MIPLVGRFSGLEIDLPWSHAIFLEQEDRIKGVSWLTILGKTWIERLGGEELLKASYRRGGRAPPAQHWGRDSGGATSTLR